MKIGCPKEIKDNENRVGLTPNSVHAYTAAGHEVFMEKGAGLGSAITDEEYVAAGAKILPTADEVWAVSDMIVKVKEPMPAEFPKMRENQLLYTYFHFAADKALTDACLKQKIIAMAYETVQESYGLPLLKPMSEVAGRMAPLMGAYYSAKTQGGRGLLPMGVTGVAPAEILVLGGGIVGTNAARVAAGLGAKVTILDINLNRLEYLSEVLGDNVVTLYSDPLNLENCLKAADIVIGAVLIPGSAAPKLVKASHLKIMKPGAVMVDVAIDQGGSFETTAGRPTTHHEPTFEKHGVIHYSVANIPGAVPVTSTYALTNATLPFAVELADKGWKNACRDNIALERGLNTVNGQCTFAGVAEAFGLPCVSTAQILR